MDRVAVNRDRRHVLGEIQEQPHPLAVALRLNQLDKLFHQRSDRRQLQIQLAMLGVGQHVLRQSVDSVEIAGQNRPTLPGEREITAVQGQLHRVGAASQALQDVLDRVAQPGHGLSDRRQPLRLHLRVHQRRVRQRQTGVLADSVE